MAEDIAPALLERVQAEFRSNLESDKTAAALLQQIQEGTATYEQAGEYAERVGAALADAFSTCLSADALPDGKLYWNIAERVVRPLLVEDYGLVSEAATQVQAALNEKAGIGIKAQTAPLNEDRVKGILNKVSAAENYDDVAWVLDEPVKTFSRSVVDDTVKTNAEFQSNAGLRPKIIRKAEYKCCEWCSKLAGVYYYDDDSVPDDIYRRHENCRCTVEMDPGDGRRQNVHTKKWTSTGNSATLEARKTVGLGSSTQRTFQSQKLLEYHYNKHSQEYGTISIPDYLKKANEIADAPLSEDVVELLRSDGSTSRYRFSTNDFVVINADGTIRTLFKPVDKEAYWQDELDRN